MTDADMCSLLEADADRCSLLEAAADLMKLGDSQTIIELVRIAVRGLDAGFYQYGDVGVEILLADTGVNFQQLVARVWQAKPMEVKLSQMEIKRG